MATVAQLSAALERGTTTSRALVEQALERIADPAGEGARAFIKVYAESARSEAEFSDQLRKRGVRRSAVDGLPVSLKDLFDVAVTLPCHEPGGAPVGFLVCGVTGSDRRILAVAAAIERELARD
jgi:Asp-tRNA(Asn)/Glu-tRNA(Gln) amidotransferase A subunit family amidase